MTNWYSEADTFMGHKAEGSATSKRSIYRRPEFVHSVTGGIEALFDELSTLMKWPLKGRNLEDQPDPDGPISRGLRDNCVTASATHLCNLLNLERETRLELATPTLASSDIDCHKTLKYQCFACS